MEKVRDCKVKIHSINLVTQRKYSKLSNNQNIKIEVIAILALLLLMEQMAQKINLWDLYMKRFKTKVGKNSYSLLSKIIVIQEFLMRS